MADGSGNSLVVSGIITYRVVDSARAALDMEHLEAYVKVQAHAVLKRVASRFPYVTYDGSPSLITEQAALSSQLAALLQDKVAVAGVHVIAYELSDLAYAKEIAPQMVRATLQPSREPYARLTPGWRILRTARAAASAGHHRCAQDNCDGRGRHRRGRDGGVEGARHGGGGGGG